MKPRPIPQWEDGIDPSSDPEPGERLGRGVWRARKAWIMTVRELNAAQDHIKQLQQRERLARQAVSLAEGRAFAPPAVATRAGGRQVRHLLSVLLKLGVNTRAELGRILATGNTGTGAAERLEALLITGGYSDSEITRMAVGIRSSRRPLEALLEGLEEQKSMTTVERELHGSQEDKSR